MSNSKELRVPLLDHEIIEYSLNIKRKFKVHKKEKKYILKQILYDYIPNHNATPYKCCYGFESLKFKL